MAAITSWDYEIDKSKALIPTIPRESTSESTLKNTMKDAPLIFFQKNHVDVSEDEQHCVGEKLQEITDKFNKKVDELLTAKQKDIM